MPRFYGPGDAEFEPAPLPEARDGFAWASHQGRLFVLGGFPADYSAATSTVYAYDPLANTWATLDPLAGPVDSYLRGASLGDWIYYCPTASTFARYNPSTGASQALTASGLSEHGLAAFGGRIYQGLAALQPRVYDPDLATWADTPSESPVAMVYEGLFEDARGIVVVVTAGSPDRSIVWRYYPKSDQWVQQDGTASYRQQAMGAYWRTGLMLLGGYDAAGTDIAPGFSRLERGATSWTEEATGGATALAAAGELVANRIVLVGGYDEAEDEAVDHVWVYGQPPHGLDVGFDVDFEASPNITYLRVEMDIWGGPGHRLDLPVVLTTGADRRLHLAVRLDVATAGAGVMPDFAEYDDEDESVIIRPGGGS